MSEPCCHGFRLRCFLFLSAFLIAPAAFCQIVVLPSIQAKKIIHKDDVIVLDNGDTLAGEIKRVENGILYFKSDRAIGTLEIDWVRVHRIRSRARYEFELFTGESFVGIMNEDPTEETESGYIRVLREDRSSIKLRIPDILSLREMQETFLGRVKLSVDVGISYTQGNNQTQWNAAAKVEYSRPRYSLDVSLNSLFSSQTEGVDTSRHEFLFLGKRTLTKNWDYLALAGLLDDSQQDLDLRVTVGGGLQRTFYRSNRTHFVGVIGFVYAAEEYSGETEGRRNNGEILIGVAFDSYRFRSSEMNVFVLAYPSVTEPGSVRLVFLNRKTAKTQRTKRLHKEIERFVRNWNNGVWNDLRRIIKQVNHESNDSRYHYLSG